VHVPKWEPCTLQSDQWCCLDCAPPIRVGEAGFVFITFTGHSRGHCGAALRVGDQWLIHCGDACIYYRQVGFSQPYKHPCGKLAEFIYSTMTNMSRRHWKTIRKLKRMHGDQIQAFCAHDAHELKEFQTGAC